MDTATRYLGLELANPLIAGASALTGNRDSIARLAESGVAAVVTKSLFEEQLQLEQFRQDEAAEATSHRHAEMETMFPRGLEAGPGEHFAWLSRVCETVDIPIIASLNAVTPERWLEYARQAEQTGVKALELNFNGGSRQLDRHGEDIERDQVAVVESVCAAVTLPVSVKMTVFHANPVDMATRFCATGAAGVVLFNAFFHPDFDTETQKSTVGGCLSRPEDIRLRLRFAGLLSGQLDGSVCVSGGVHGPDGIVKALLAGADAVQMVSAFYRRSTGGARDCLDGVRRWMDEHECETLQAFRGRLNHDNNPDKWTYARAQYIQALLRPDPLAPPRGA